MENEPAAIPSALARVGQVERRWLLGSVDVERRDDGGMAKLTGHSAVFNSKSEDLGFFTEIIRPGAFLDAIRSFDVVCLANHNVDRLLAGTVNKTLSLMEDKRGLYMEASPMDTQVCRDTITEVESRLLNGQSFSFDIGTDSWRMENGMQLREIITVSRLYDVGPVVFPAYPATDVAARGLMAAAGVDVESFSSAMVKQFRHMPLTPGDRDLIKRAIAVLQLTEEEDRQEPIVPDEQPAAPEAWRMQHLRRRLELAAISA
jgi:HK97 family phage prohead protease